MTTFNRVLKARRYMQENRKYRSIKAFVDYDKSESGSGISQNRILALIKQSGGTMRKKDIAGQLKADIDSVNQALFTLLQDGVVTIEETGADKGDDLVKL